MILMVGNGFYRTMEPDPLPFLVLMSLQNAVMHLQFLKEKKVRKKNDKNFAFALMPFDSLLFALSNMRYCRQTRNSIVKNRGAKK